MPLDIPSAPLSDSVGYARHAAVAIITIDNPPVNGLGHSVRQGLLAGVKKAADDQAVRAVIIRGAGRMFCGGADIRQFNTPAASAAPTSRQVVAAIESSAKPFIAAIHGNALGGGLELAMGCHYRIADRAARLGLPEIKLGLLPGGGGTQRLPRLIGLSPALGMILGGNPIGAARAAELGLVDRLADDDLLAAALEFASDIAAQTEHPVARNRPPPQDTSGLIAQERARLSSRRHPGAAALACLNCLDAATLMPFEEALTYERSRFEELVAGAESKAIRHLFFAEREAGKIPGITGKVEPLPVNRVAVIGAGTMGGGIAMALVNAGIPVTLIEREAAALDRGLATIRKNYAITVSKGKLSAEAVAEREKLITPTVELSAVADADLVIEAVFEDMEVKKALFDELDRLCRPGAILATNTSRLDVNAIASATSRPEAVVGLHFFSPANVMRLLEVVRPDKVAPEVMATAMALAQHIGKLPVVSGVCEGFIGNRMLTPYWKEAWFLLEEGASPSQIDRALQDFGMAMGPLALSDLTGLDINWAARKRLAPTRPKHLRYSRVPDRICELGRFGQKTGAGFYRYEPGSRTPIPDPDIDALIEECAREAGIRRRTVTDSEIVERCIYALVNEGASILNDGIAQRASDIDLVYVNGYGFPAHRGGPMYHADMIGLASVFARVEAWHAAGEAHWAPCELFRRLATEGGQFNR